MEKITLTEPEKKLYEEINLNLDSSFSSPNSQEKLSKATNASRQLTISLMNRNVIPKIRLRYLNDPEYNVGSLKSRIEIFESNGTRGEEIYGHGNFLKHLKYLIDGPDLPLSVISQFQKIINDDKGTSGELQDEVRKFTRSTCRKLNMTPKQAAEEFYKLALECELDESFSLSIRKAAMSVR